jgi:hypothetical protein
MPGTARLFVFIPTPDLFGHTTSEPIKALRRAISKSNECRMAPRMRKGTLLLIKFFLLQRLIECDV